MTSLHWTLWGCMVQWTFWGLISKLCISISRVNKRRWHFPVGWGVARFWNNLTEIDRPNNCAVFTLSSITCLICLKLCRLGKWGRDTEMDPSETGIGLHYNLSFLLFTVYRVLKLVKISYPEYTVLPFS